MSKNSKPLIRLEGIQQAFQNRVILDVNQLEIEQGKLTLLSGANGAGKTSLMRVMAGLTKPDPVSYTHLTLPTS